MPTITAGSLFYAVCSESKFFRDSGCIFIWSVYVYLLFRGLYESYPQNESEEFVEWKSALPDAICSIPFLILTFASILPTTILNVNDIGSGLNRAIDEAMRNERLKTDLITNVSHDIKTPLTSIINYVDILKRSDIADEKILGYLDILEVKAQRLKTLTEDVVEASKVSSGNITLEYMDIDFREMVQQTEGEMAEKFAARNLSVVLNLPEEAAVIHVDGRRMWRVLENIFGNAAKYAMPGTRVYADLSVSESEVKFSLKNVSEQQLNISADELTERFIRGDISRSTEGSGLGLSIAKSLTEMQGGVFELYLDGDLFKVDIRFPRIKPM